MYGLIDQLKDLMNKDVQITSIVGFYIPVSFGHMELVTCMQMGRTGICLQMLSTQITKRRYTSGSQNCF